MGSYHLVGDIGGTKSRLAIINEKLKIINKKEYKSKDYKSLFKIIKYFLKNNKIII